MPLCFCFCYGFYFKWPFSQSIINLPTSYFLTKAQFKCLLVTFPQKPWQYDSSFSPPSTLCFFPLLQHMKHIIIIILFSYFPIWLCQWQEFSLILFVALVPSTLPMASYVFNKSLQANSMKKWMNWTHWRLWGSVSRALC